MTHNETPAEPDAGNESRTPGTPGRHRVDRSPSTAADRGERVLTPEQKRELTIDTMASWALDGMEPDRQTVENINEFLSSGLTASEYVQRLKARYTTHEPDSEP